MSALIDLTGQRFGRLTVTSRAGSRRRQALWECICDCGNTTQAVSYDLRSGNTRSCGCYKQERIVEANIKHGGKNTRLYHIWKGMRYRCYGKTSARFQDYGGRGIKICKEWDDFAVFRDWAIANGYASHLTIERKDVNGDYTPENCTWITLAKQSENKQNTLRVTYRGKSYRLVDLAKQVGINYHTIYSRLLSGWSIEDAVERPTKRENRPRCARPRGGKEKSMLASF